MKNILCLFVLWPTLILAQEIQPDLHLKKATVYLKSAELTSVSNLALPKGQSKVVFSQLSSNINPNSVHIRGLKDVQLISVDYHIDFLSETNKPQKLKTLEALYESKKLAQAKIQSRQEGLEAEKSLLEANRASGAANSSVTLGTLKQKATYYRERFAELHVQLYQIQQKTKKLEAELDKLQKEIDKFRFQHAKQFGEIVLLFQSSEAKQLDLSLTYVVNNAGWYPTYSINMSSTSAPLQIDYKAQVYQKTGNDWEDVQLTLSTGKPFVNAQKPTVEPYYLHFEQPVSKGYFRKINGIATSEVAVQSPSMMDRQNARHSAAVVKKLEKLTATEFRLPGTYSIPSLAEGKSLVISQITAPAKYEYYAAPLLSAHVFLIAEVEQWASYDFLPGKANVYANNTYVGRTQITSAETDATKTISLSVVPSVVVERERVDNHKAQSFLGNTRIVNRHYKISLKNTRSEAVTVVVQDRIPYSQNEQIKVENKKYGNANYDEQTGILTWTIKLRPNASETVEFRYEIRYPKGKKVNLN